MYLTQWKKILHIPDEICTIFTLPRIARNWRLRNKLSYGIMANYLQSVESEYANTRDKKLRWTIGQKSLNVLLRFYANVFEKKKNLLYSRMRIYRCHSDWIDVFMIHVIFILVVLTVAASKSVLIIHITLIPKMPVFH